MAQCLRSTGSRDRFRPVHLDGGIREMRSGKARARARLPAPAKSRLSYLADPTGGAPRGRRADASSANPSGLLRQSRGSPSSIQPAHHHGAEQAVYQPRKSA